jgi:hypothetical protein
MLEDKVDLLRKLDKNKSLEELVAIVETYLSTVNIPEEEKQYLLGLIDISRAQQAKIEEDK